MKGELIKLHSIYFIYIDHFSITHLYQTYLETYSEYVDAIVKAYT